MSLSQTISVDVQRLLIAGRIPGNFNPFRIAQLDAEMIQKVRIDGARQVKLNLANLAVAFLPFRNHQNDTSFIDIGSKVAVKMRDGFGE